MASARSVTVHVVPGQPQQQWCDGCMTSSAFTVNVYAFIGTQRPPTSPIGTVTACMRCDRDDSNPDDSRDDSPRVR